MNPSKDSTEGPSKPVRIETLLLIVLLILTVFLMIGISRQSKQIKDLKVQNQQTFAHLMVHRKMTNMKLDALTQKINKLELSTGDSALSTDPKLDTIDVAEMKDGLYTYADKIKMSATSGKRKSNYIKDYKVSVIKSGIGAGDYKMEIVIGIATCTGLPQFFIDYDGDKLVDLELMEELVDSMPFGGLLAKKMNIGNSQNLYDSFLLNHDSADHLAASDIDEKGSTVAKSLWKLITDQSDKITGWIGK